MVEKEMCQITENGVPCKNEGYENVITGLFTIHTLCKEHYERAKKELVE